MKLQKIKKTSNLEPASTLLNFTHSERIEWDGKFLITGLSSTYHRSANA
jgi:hypothetical protein